MLTSFGLQKDPDKFLLRSKETMSDLDRQLLDQPELADAFIHGMREAFRSGIRGAHLDAALYTRPWGFDLKEITAEVHLWHGEQDLNVPVSVGRYAAAAIPNCQAIFLDTEGHLTLPHHHGANILSTLVA